jgi:predicted lipoprotein with Yx(FWY)xxD motif
MNLSSNRRRFIAVAFLALAVAALLAGFAAAHSMKSSRGAVVTTAANAKLGKKILVTMNGRTLYSLSVEHAGHFICANGSCLALWHPLRPVAGAAPTGVAGLSVLSRPDRTKQVAWKGHPLYTFTGDHKKGDVNGNGFKDVGVWRVISLGAASSTSPSTSTTTQTTTSPYGY